MLGHHAIVSVYLAAASAAFLHPVEAASRRSGWEGGGHVVAESRHGNGTISGPVRAGRTGWEVRLPRGTWVGCRRSCSETLRVETIDYLEGDHGLVGRGGLHNECGIFGCLDVDIPLDR